MRIVVIDDHPLVHQGIQMIANSSEELEVVGTASTGDEGVRLLRRAQPDVALVDLRLPGTTGLDIIEEAREEVPDCKFMILTSYSDEGDVRRAMSKNVDGYILKEAMPEELISALNLVARGRTYVDPTIMQTLFSNDHDPLDDLTPRELQVLRALAKGLSNSDIAGQLYITESTVKKHVGQILSKLELTDRTQAALYAVSRGVAEPPEL
jgi:DNA-binding NarL/FixJ family response regulator